jgi:AraC-like DNA-binding protein
MTQSQFTQDLGSLISTRMVSTARKLYGPSVVEQRATPEPGIIVSDVIGDSKNLSGRQLRCMLAPGVGLMCSKLLNPGFDRYTLRAPGFLLLQWRLAARARIRPAAEEPAAFAYLTYLPPRRALDFQYFRGAWDTVALFGTPASFQRRWRLAEPLAEALGCAVENLAAIQSPRRCPMRLDARAYGALVDLLNAPWSGPMLHARLESEVLALILGSHRAQIHSTRTAVAPRDLDVVQRARSLLARYPERAHTLQSVSSEFGLNRNKLARLFREAFGVSFYQCLQRERLQLAWNLLSRSTQVARAANSAGYRDSASFARAFRKHFGISPRAVGRRIVGGEEPTRRAPFKSRP